MEVTCPKCGHKNKIDIMKAVDEHGEVFLCSSCGYPFRYTDK